MMLAPLNLDCSNTMPSYSLCLNIHNISINYESNHQSFTKELAGEFPGFVVQHIGKPDPDIKINFYDLERAPHLAHKMSQLQSRGHNIEQVNLQTRIINIIDFTEFSLNFFVKPGWNLDEALLLLVGSLGAMVRFKLSQRLKVTAFHAASLAWGGEGLLLLGDTGAGKTSLSYLCIKQGFSYLTDEDSFVEERSGEDWRILGYQRRIRLDNETLAYFPEVINQHDKLRPFQLFDQPGYIVDPYHIAPSAYIQSVPLRVAVVLRNDKDCAVSQLKRLDKSRARLWLLHCLESAQDTDFLFDGNSNLNRQGFYLVDNLLDRIQVFELKYNIREHFLSIPQYLREILALIKRDI
jgi:hypothetical protein